MIKSFFFVWDWVYGVLGFDVKFDVLVVCYDFDYGFDDWLRRGFDMVFVFLEKLVILVRFVDFFNYVKI